MLGGIRFLWDATRGYRLTPWKSPYLRWRMETYSGLKADEIQFRDFVRVIWEDRGQFMRFLKWTGEIRKYTQAAEEQGKR